VAALNHWTPQQNAQWLAVRLVGHAQIAFQNLPAEAWDLYDVAEAPLLRHFEPQSEKDCMLGISMHGKRNRERIGLAMART
jgi:hypothetical protein